MNPLLYGELAPFYHLLDPLEDHADEAEAFCSVLRAAVPEARSLLELGAGAGHGAHFVKRCFSEVTLSDLSEPMLARSRALNPDCEHVVGDMRSLRLGQVFDCVLVHDAICHLCSEADLLAAMVTAFEHLRPGGAALLVPDCVKDTYQESHEDHAGDDERASLRCLSWSYDPDPSDDTHIVDYVFLLREAGEVRAVHDRHEFGLFTMATWCRLGEEAGFRVEPVQRPLPPEYAGSGYADVMFLCRKPGASP